jgi:hypothetical protein
VPDQISRLSDSLSDRILQESKQTHARDMPRVGGFNLVRRAICLGGRESIFGIAAMRNSLHFIIFRRATFRDLTLCHLFPTPFLS